MTSRRGPFGILASVLFLLVAMAAPAAAEEPGFRLGVITWGEADWSGQADTLTYGGRLVADGPLVGTEGRMRIGVALDVTAAPGEAFDLTSIESFGRAAEVTIGSTVLLAQRSFGTQSIATSLYAEGGFTTAVGGVVQDRYKRQVGFGAEFAVTLAPDRRAFLRVGYARDELQGYIGAGALRLTGQVPIGGKGLLLGGEALLNLSRASVTPQRDRFQLYGGVDLSRLYGVIAGS